MTIFIDPDGASTTSRGSVLGESMGSIGAGTGAETGFGVATGATAGSGDTSGRTMGSVAVGGDASDGSGAMNSADPCINVHLLLTLF